MKVFVLTSRIPFPLEKGDKLRLHHQLKHLGKTHEVTLCCLSDSGLTEEQHEALRPMVKEIHVVRLSWFRRMWRMAWSWASILPFQVVWFTERKAKRHIRELIQAHQPDVIYCQLVRCAEYVKDLHELPKVLDYMDALSAGMHRRSHTKSSLHQRATQWLFRTEGTRLARYESRVFDYFDACTIISQNDRLLIQHRDRDRIELIPNGVDLEAFAPKTLSKVASTNDPVILFTGNMSYPPNVDAAQHLVEDILPLVSHPTVRVVLAGAEPKPSLKALANDRVTVTGWVDDIVEVYQQATLFVAPLRIGTGLQNKVLEAMATELPCVLSPHAFAPLNLPSTDHAVVCDSAQSFATAIDDLLNAPQKATHMAQRARTSIEAQFTWQAHSESLAQLLDEVGCMK
jgi:sugar transferase (PEP-CTERM/EpsH1 system associated)